MAGPFKYTAKQLESKYNDYIEWLKTQSYKKPEMIKSGQLAGTVNYLEFPKPQTIGGFCLFADIEESTFYRYANEGNKGEGKDIRNTATRIRKLIEDHQLGGASVGVYNSSIIAKKLGLKEEMSIEHTGEKNTINIQIDGKEIHLK